MKKTLALLAAAAMAVVAVPAIAKSDKDKKVQPRWAHTYAGAVEEARERGCFLLATFHIEH
jgi:hypothetical protein